MNKETLIRSVASASLALMLALASSAGALQASTAADTAPLTKTALANAEYPVPIELAASGVVQLTDGKYEDPENQIAISLVGPQANGDLNGDGAPDAAVTLVASSGASGVFSYLAAVINDDGAAKPVDTAFLGDRVNVRRVVIRNSQIAVTFLQRRPTQPMSARPTVAVAWRYKLNADGDALIGLSPLTNVQLAYATYPLEGAPESGAAFVAGKYESEDPPVTAELLAPRATGDLNGDGSPDSAVSLVQNTGGSGNFRYVAAVLNDQNRPVPVDVGFIGDRVLVRRVSIRNGVITVDYLDRKPDQPMSARPTVLAKKQFKLEDTTLVEITPEAQAQAGAEAPPAAPEAAALSGILTGTVSYLQRIALAPDAVIDVQLQDVSRADAPAEVIASQIITAEGKQVPIPYELVYDPAKIDPKYTYSVRARITEGGQLRWTSTRMYPVLTRGNPVTGVDIVVQPVGAAAVEPVAPAEIVTPTDVVTPTLDTSAILTNTVVETLASDPRFSTLVSAVAAASLDNALSSEGPFTIFAPTNEAFAKLDQETLNTLLQNDMQQVTDILLYHVVPAKVTSADAAEPTEVDTALPGAKLSLKPSDGSVVANNKVLVTQADIPAANGVIHVIDAVLLPPMSATTRLALDGRFRGLVTGIMEAGLAETLDMQLTDYTLFAPTDQAVAKLPRGALDELLANKKLLADLLTYHIVTPTLMAADVVKASGSELPTLLAGFTLPISATESAVMVKDAQVVDADIKITGGVVHAIDTVLLPAETFGMAGGPDFPGVITGTVTYLQRSALSPRAQVVVQLQDVSAADAPAVVLAQTRILARGRQVPFAFTLNYDAGSIDPNGRYAIQAGIFEDGGLIFKNAQAYPVLTGGNPLTGIEVLVEPVK